MSEGSPAEYGLVMPFVTVVSHGGPHDDDSYVAGYEMGLLAGRLESKPHVLTVTIHTVNAEQADLIAMMSGYHPELTGGAIDGWRQLRLTRLDLADGVVV